MRPSLESGTPRPTVQRVWRHRIHNLWHNTLNNDSYYLTTTWDGRGQVSGPKPGTHRYLLHVAGLNTLNMTTTFSLERMYDAVSLEALERQSTSWWESYWTSSAFIHLTSVNSTDAMELQRRIILSQCLLAVNSASSLPPQESGLVNNT